MGSEMCIRDSYIGFAEQELPTRDDFGNPPFTKLARLVVRGESQIKAGQMIGHLAESIQIAADELKMVVQLQGPSIAPIEKLRGRYRFHLLVVAPGPDILQPVIQRAKDRIKEIDGVQWIVDIDPNDMM